MFAVANGIVCPLHGNKPINNFPPRESPTISNNIPPAASDIPVIHNGFTLLQVFLQMTFALTVKIEAQTISISPIPSDIFNALTFNAIIPPIPKNAAISLLTLNLSLLINKKEKHIKNNTPSCFKSAVLELSVRESPIYVHA